MYLALDELKEVSIELSTKCNAACPMCSRYRRSWESAEFDTQKPNPLMPLQDLPFEVFAQGFNKELISKMNGFIFNGKLGEPLIHPRALEFFEHIRKHSDRADITIFTNGSLESPQFWTELAKILKPTDRVNFSIDGLEDTNSIYRQKTSWKKIIQSASSFIEAGGSAYWDFIVFRHNEHQIEEARALANQLKFKGFEIRKTNRFKAQEDFQYLDVDGRLQKLQVPQQKNYVYEYHHEYLHSQPARPDISCSFKSAGKLFLSYSGKLWPCSYISEYFPSSESMLNIVSKYGETFNDLRFHSIKEILNSPYFSTELEKSWQTGECIAKECWKKCSRGHFNITSVTEAI